MLRWKSLHSMLLLRCAEVRAGAIVAMDGYADSDLAADYDPHTNVVSDAVEREINAALEAMVVLAK